MISNSAIAAAAEQRRPGRAATVVVGAGAGRGHGGGGGAGGGREPDRVPHEHRVGQHGQRAHLASPWLPCGWHVWRVALVALV